MTKGAYNCSATFLWIGERTRQLDGAHIEYVRGLRNPIGVKIGPSTKPIDVLNILEVLCGDNPSEPGRVTLITRIGVDKVNTVLPDILKAVQNSSFFPVWMCDPCHGNTFSHHGVKTRCTATMLREVEQTIVILAAQGVTLGGLHLEQTGENVVECVDSVPLDTDDINLRDNYKSLCDPRMSRAQAQAFIESVAVMLFNANLPAKPAYENQLGQIFQVSTLERFSHYFMVWPPII